MQLEVSEIKALEPVKFNYEQLKQELATKVENYKSIVYTEESMKAAKADRANFNKLAKALNDEKIRVKNIVLEPFAVFEKQCNELISLAKDASGHIDSQVKEYEQKQKDEKLQQIMNFFIENVGDYKDLIDFDKIFNDRWLNVTYKMEQIEKDISHIITKTQTDMKVIDTQFQDENICKQVKMEYFMQIANPSVLTLAILKGNNIIEENKKLEELKQKESESLQKNMQNEQKTVNYEQNIAESSQKITNSEQNVENGNEELMTIDFNVRVTLSQMNNLKRFLVENGIVPRQGISEKDVELVVSKIEDRVQWCREEGENDMRIILHYVQGIIDNLNKLGTKDTIRKLKEEE